MAEGTVKLFGSHVKKGYVYAGGAVVAGAAAVGYVRSKRAGGTATAPAAGDGSTTDSSGLAAGIDPATGYPTGSAADTEALGALSGVGGFGGGGGFITTGSSAAPAFTTNGQWAQNAEAYLTSSAGADATTVSSALGKYLTGQALTANQADVVEQAIAFDGYPPQSGSTGFPPSLNMQSGGGGGDTGDPGTTVPPPPGGTGTGQGASGRLTAPTGLRVTVRGKTGVQVTWNGVPGASGYVAQAKTGGPNGANANGPFSTSSTVANFGNLKPGTSYTALIWPSDAQIKGGPNTGQPHAQVSFTTTS